MRKSPRRPGEGRRPGRRHNGLQELFRLGSDLLRMGGARAAGRPVLDAQGTLGEGLHGVVEGSWVVLTGEGIRRADAGCRPLPSKLVQGLAKPSRS